jgi:signal transduction histidine kinase
MADTGWKILLVEDDQDDYLLVNAWLRQVMGRQYSLNWASSYQSAVRAIESEPFDVVLVDYHLDSHSGLDFIQESKSKKADIPFILLTGQGNYEVDVTAMESGASDYLSKAEITGPLLERSIRYAIQQKNIEIEMRKAYKKVEKLVDERTEELIEAKRKIIDNVELERRRMAQEIHDGPIQDLLGISLLMLGKAKTVSEEKLITNLHNAISKVVDSLRDSIKELRSSSYAPFNLEESIRINATEFAKNHPELKISLDLMPDFSSFPERSRLALFRIYQQALANIIQHAQAKNVDISLIQTPQEVILEIGDDGKGFEVPECLSDLVAKGHFGLVGSYERAIAVGGEYEVKSSLGHGTVIRVILPCETEKKTEKLIA